jgi:hypothetical protein
MSHELDRKKIEDLVNCIEKHYGSQRCQGYACLIPRTVCLTIAVWAKKLTPGENIKLGDET